MGTRTEATSFGSITIDGQIYQHDVLIRLDGTVHKRKKKLSKALYGTSHKISLSEAEHIYEVGAKILIIGTGQFDQVRLSDEAQSYFDSRGMTIQTMATPDAIQAWNEADEETVGLFHVTC